MELTGLLHSWVALTQKNISPYTLSGMLGGPQRRWWSSVEYKSHLPLMRIELRFLDLSFSSLVIILIQRVHLSERSFRKCDPMRIDVTGPAACCPHQQYVAAPHKTSVHAYLQYGVTSKARLSSQAPSGKPHISPQCRCYFPTTHFMLLDTASLLGCKLKIWEHLSFPLWDAISLLSSG